MNFFDEATLRLKQQLKVTEDKQVAAALDLTDSAWKMRKKRESFPIKEVFALSAMRPELGLDPDWIVTGLSPTIETINKAERHLLECFRLMTDNDRNAATKIFTALSDINNLSGDEINRRLGNDKS